MESGKGFEGFRILKRCSAHCLVLSTAIEATDCEHRPAVVRRSISTADHSADFKLKELSVMGPQNLVFQGASGPASALGIRSMGAAYPPDTLRFHS